MSFTLPPRFRQILASRRSHRFGSAPLGPSLLCGPYLPAVLILTALALGGCDRAEPLPGQGEDAGKTVVYRDTWGVPHIYAPTIEAGLYAMGYAQAEDRPEQLLQNLMLAIGEFSEVVGAAGVPSDLRARMWDHYGAGKRALAGLDETLDRELDAFVAGMNDFYQEHPEDRPEWWGDRQIDPAMIFAFGRLFLYNWSIDEAYEDLIRGGIDPGYQADQRGSNQFAVAPSRSAEGAAILAIDPHLSWTGPSRFWEVRIHAGDLVGSGVTLAGSPYIGLGHNRDVAWAMTTGGPDTADIYELTLEEGQLSVGDGEPGRYLYDGDWRDLERREVTLEVRGEEAQTHSLWFSHHGPIVAHRDGKAYAAKIAYQDLVTLDAWRRLSLAKDYSGAVDAMATLTLFPQNVMVADTSGNIYYQRTGRVPVRDLAFDWSRPVDGSLQTSEWQGAHPASDHLQVLNPPQGYMQNCNIPPDAMMVDSPFTLASQPDYLYSGPGYGPSRAGWTSQRGARAVELLAGDDSVTVEEAKAYINDLSPYGADRWVEALRRAHQEIGNSLRDHEHYSQGIETILAWDGRLNADSVGGLQYAMWRERLAENLGRERENAIAGEIDSFYSIVRGEEEPALEIEAQALAELAQSYANALGDIVDTFGSLEATYGDRYRVGRGDRSWPVGGGGGRNGTTTLRNMGYDGERDDGTRWGRSGQTSTQIVVLTDPPQSWIYLPLGQSDRPESPHYADQAEKLFSRAELKPSWWRPVELAGHIETRTVLDRAP